MNSVMLHVRYCVVFALSITSVYWSDLNVYLSEFNNFQKFYVLQFTILHVLSLLQLNKYVQILSQHAVDPELVKQVFRQVTMVTHIKLWNLFDVTYTKLRLNSSVCGGTFSYIRRHVFQLYYYIGSNALNNLLLRKDMCNWSKGMQIRWVQV